MERIVRAAHWLLATSACVAPAAALAQSTVPSADLAARVERMEAELATLRAELAAARSAPAPAAAPPAAAPASVAKDGFSAGATRVRLGGFVKTVASSSRFSDGEVATNSLGRDFYLPQAIPTHGGPASRVQDFSAKQTRLWLDLKRDIAGHSVGAYVETDFQTAAGTQGSQRTTNGYNLALRRAYVQIDGFTVGQDWTTFQYVGALPESTDFVGATEGTVFVREPLIRYSAPLGGGATLHVALENPESGTATLGTPALVENGDDRLPDAVARLAYAGSLGELSLAGLVREVRVEAAGVADHRLGWGVSAGGKLFLAADKRSDVRFMATYGRNIGRYVGLNFAPDAVLVPGSGLADVTVFAALGAARVEIAQDVRVNLIGSYQHVGYADTLSPVALAGFNRSAWSAAANLFWSPVPQVDVGIELRHGERRLVSGAAGQLDRVELAVKYGF